MYTPNPHPNRSSGVVDVVVDGPVDDVVDDVDGPNKKKKVKLYGSSYREIRNRRETPTWGPNKFSKANHPLQIMV